MKATSPLIRIYRMSVWKLGATVAINFGGREIRANGRIQPCNENRTRERSWYLIYDSIKEQTLRVLTYYWYLIYQSNNDDVYENNFLTQSVWG